MISCVSQEVPEITPDSYKSPDESKKESACLAYSELVLNRALSHKAFTSLFECRGWDKINVEGSFPYFYRAIQNIGPKHWNHIFLPINDQLFSQKNIQKRELLFQYVRELDNEEGLDDLGTVISALNDVNFFDALKILFNCAEKGRGSCPDSKKDKSLTKEEIFEILKVVDVKESTVLSLSVVVKELINAISGNIEPYKKNYNKLFASEDSSEMFKVARRKLIDQFSGKFLDDGIIERDKNFFLSMLLTKKNNEELPWISSWFRNEELAEDNFKKLITFPISEYPKMSKDFNVINSNFNKDINCIYRADDRLISINLKEQLENYVEEIIEGNRTSLYDYMLQDISKIVTASAFCPDIINLKGKTKTNSLHEVNLFNVVEKLNSFMDTDIFYELSKMILYFSSDDYIKKESLYALEFFGDDIFIKFNELNSVIYTTSPGLFFDMLKTMKNLEPASYTSAANVFETVSGDDNRDKLEAVSKLWQFYSGPEKEFLFNFADRHMYQDVNTIPLLQFYSKLMGLFKNVIPAVAAEWTGDKEKLDKSYEAIKSLVINMSGENVREDFEDFYKRDQILKLIEIISKNTGGGNIKDENRDFLDKYRGDAKKKKYSIRIKKDLEGVDYQKFLCIDKISSSGLEFYDAIIQLPPQCQNIETDSFSFTVLFWFNFINSDFVRIQDNLSSIALATNGYFFDKQGLLSPRMLNSSLAVMKLLDDSLETAEEGGMRYLLESIRYHLYSLNETGQIHFYDKSIELIASFMTEKYAEQVIFRSKLISEFTEEENYGQIEGAINATADVMTGYGQWVDGDQYKDIEYKYDSKYSCINYLETKVGNSICPDRETVSETANWIVNKLSIDYEDEDEDNSMAGAFIEAMIPGLGVGIPYKNSDKEDRSLFRITPKEIFEMLYETSDKGLKVNRSVVKYTSREDSRLKKLMRRKGSVPDQDSDDKEDKTYELTTLERIEVTLREVAFDNNYLGVGYKNAIAATDDYVKTAKSKLSLLKFCSSIKNCLRKLNSDEKRMAKNAAKSFGGLIDAETVFSRGNFLQAVLITAVSSSADDVRKAQSRPHSQKKLERHNGVVLTKLSSIGALTNMGRVIHDRVGRTREEFDSFINGPSFKRVDGLLMARFPVVKVKKKIEIILGKILEIKNSNNRNMITELVNWFSSLSYQEVRLVEDTLGNLLLLSTYIGPPDLVYDEEDKNRFRLNSIYSLFDGLDILLTLWPSVQSEFPEDARLIDLFKPLNRVARFFKARLLKSNDSSDSYYVLINTMYSVLSNTLFTKKGSWKGIEFLSSFGTKIGNMGKMNTVIRSFYNYMDILHGPKSTGGWFVNFGEQLKKTPVKDLFASEVVKDYLLYTTIPFLNSDSSGGYMRSNFHYDEPASLLFYLSKKNERSTTSNFELAMDAVFRKEFDNISSLFDEIFATIKVN